MYRFRQNVTVNSLSTAEQSPNCVQHIAVRMFLSFCLISLKDSWKTTMEFPLICWKLWLYLLLMMFYTHMPGKNPFSLVFEISWNDTKQKFLGEIFKIITFAETLPCVLPCVSESNVIMQMIIGASFSRFPFF